MKSSIIQIALITYKEGLRHRILYGVISAALLLIIASILLSGLFMRDLLKVILDICQSATSVGGLLIPFFLAINLLAGDIENKTIFAILAKPVSRQQYILGKFTGLTLLTGMVMFILTCATLLSIYGATFIYPQAVFSSLSIQSIVFSSVMAFLGVTVLNSTVILWCSVTTSSFLATLLTLSTYMIGQSTENLVRFLNVSGEEAAVSPMVQKIVHGVMYIFPNLSAFDFKQLAAHGLAIPMQEMVFLLFYSISYSVIMLMLSMYLFNKRDLS